MIDGIDLPIIICLAVIFFYSGNSDTPISIILAIFFYYILKLVVKMKYKKTNGKYEIRDILNITGKNKYENFIDFVPENISDKLYEL